MNEMNEKEMWKEKGDSGKKKKMRAHTYTHAAFAKSEN